MLNKPPASVTIILTEYTPAGKPFLAFKPAEPVVPLGTILKYPLPVTSLPLASITLNISQFNSKPSKLVVPLPLPATTV